MDLSDRKPPQAESRRAPAVIPPSKTRPPHSRKQGKTNKTFLKRLAVAAVSPPPEALDPEDTVATIRVSSLRRWKNTGKSSSEPLIRRWRKKAAVRLDDRATDAKSHSHALGLGRVEWIK